MSKLLEQWGCLNMGTLKHVIVILDASESAQAFHTQIDLLAQHIIDQLPAEIDIEVYFLGNPTPYSVRQLDRLGPKWFKENGNRASLVTPVFEQLQFSCGHTIVVIGSGTLFDLEDWEDTPFEKCVMLVSLHEPMANAQSPFLQYDYSEVETILQKLYDYVTTVEITCKGWMPTWWDQPGYHLKQDETGVSLVGENLENYDITLRFLSPPGAFPDATFSRQSGFQDGIPLVPLENACTMARQSQGCLTAHETETLTRAASRQAFSCPHCNQVHAWDTLFCQNGRGFAEPVYPSLRNHSGFVLLWHEKGQVKFQGLTGEVLPVAPDLVAVCKKNAGVLMRYDREQACWMNTAELLTPYHPIEGADYALVI